MRASQVGRAAAISPDLEAFSFHQGVISRASAGDLKAQREMRDLALSAYADGLTDIVTGSFWAVIMARLAAAHGEPVDKLALASAICFHAAAFERECPERHDELVGEAFAIVDALADSTTEPSEFAARFLQQHAGDVRPAVLRRANELRGLI